MTLKHLGELLLGQLPESWRADRLKAHLSRNDGGAWGEDPKGENDIVVLRSTEQTVDGRWLLESPALRNLTAKERAATLLLEGDLLVTKSSGSSLHIGKTTLVDNEVAALECGYSNFMQRLRTAPGLSPKLAWYLLNHPLVREQFDVLSNSTTGLANLNAGVIGSVLVPVPPTELQPAIAAFLDRETGKIDALVGEQRRLIELLKEKRQAVISHAVTKGLAPNARMKPSGIDWLGDVPAHWDVVPCGYRYYVQLGRMLNEERAQGYDLRPYLRVLDVQWHRINVDDLPVMNFPAEARERYRLEPGDLLVNEGGSYVGRSAIWSGDLSECYYQKALHRLRPRNGSRDTATYLLWVMEMTTKMGVFVAGGNQTTIDHLTAEQLRGQRLPFPPVEEQAQVAQFLARETGRLELLKNEALAAMDLLKERRAALISSAVTGKIDVRETRSAPAVEAINVDRIRLLVAAEIVDLLSHNKSFGRVKLQKLLYLAEADAGIGELQGQYLRAAAGPLDRTLIAEVDAGLQQDQHVAVVQSDGPGSRVVYHLRGERGAYHHELVASIGDRTATLCALVEKLGDLDTKAVEAVATLYAVWNDALLDHREPTDAMVVSGVLEDWHPEKSRKFKAEELLTWLGWMRRNKLVPRGNGPRTTTGRLFA